MKARVGALLAALLASACGPSVQSALHPAGPLARRITHLWWLMFWVCLLVFAAVLFALVWAVGHGRRRREPTLPADTDPAMGRAVAWATGLTVLVLFALLAASVATGRALSTADRRDALTIKVTGKQWWWQVEYEDPVPSQRVTTANELHLPLGRPVVLRVTSTDVIHSFWAPNLQGKVDLIPTHVNTRLLSVDRAGTYRGQCAEFCGLQHAHMALTVVAEPEAQFQGWLQAARGTAVEPSTEAERRGRDVFLSLPCPVCHTVSGTPAGGKNAPDLTHLASRSTLAAGTLPNTRGHLAAWIVDPQSVKPGTKMPANLVHADDLQDLLSYLQSLR